MRVAVLARDGDDQHEIESRVKQRFKLVKKRPDTVVCVGGDGTLLIAERRFPDVPKLQVKDSDLCRTCVGYDHPVDELLERLAENKYAIVEHPKLQAQWLRKGKKKGEYVCTNDFSIRNQLLIQALRFQVFIDDDVVLQEEFEGVIFDYKKEE